MFLWEKLGKTFEPPDSRMPLRGAQYPVWGSADSFLPPPLSVLSVLFFFTVPRAGPQRLQKYPSLWSSFLLCKFCENPSCVQIQTIQCLRTQNAPRNIWHCTHEKDTNTPVSIVSFTVIVGVVIAEDPNEAHSAGGRWGIIIMNLTYQTRTKKCCKYREAGNKNHISKPRRPKMWCWRELKINCWSLYCRLE